MTNIKSINKTGRTLPPARHAKQQIICSMHCHSLLLTKHPDASPAACCMPPAELLSGPVVALQQLVHSLELVPLPGRCCSRVASSAVQGLAAVAVPHAPAAAAVLLLIQLDWPDHVPHQRIHSHCMLTHDIYQHGLVTANFPNNMILSSMNQCTEGNNTCA